MVDAYTNIYAPMLPLLMPQLGLSGRGGGHAGDVFPDVQFGVAAGIWRAGRSLAAANPGHPGPLLAVIVLSFVGLATPA